MRLKGGFFSESAIRFSNLPLSKKNSPRNYPELKSKIPAHNTHITVMGRNFKFQVQDSFFGIFFLGDLKNKSHFLKKATFTIHC